MLRFKIWYHSVMKDMYNLLARTSLNRRKADEYPPLAFKHAIQAEIYRNQLAAKK